MSGVRLLRGSDPSLLATAQRTVVRELVGDGDHDLLVEGFDGDDYELGAVLGAAVTPPFLTDRRIVVARGVERFFDAEGAAALAAYLADPMPTTELVLTASGGRLPKLLAEALKLHGAIVVDTDAPSGRRERQGWLDEHLGVASVRLDAKARSLIGERLGEDLGRLDAVLAALTSAFGDGARLGAADVAPFVGEAGSVPPWDLTDAIDRGDVPTAVAMLRRMTEGGERHPLAVLAIVHTHYSRMARLDGAEATDQQAAAELLGLKSAFQAKKSLDQVRKLGHEGVVRAIQLLAEADLALRGARDWPDDAVLEVLVARLARLAPPGRSASRRS